MPFVREAFELFSTGAFPIEDIRKASWKNGLKLQRSQFSNMLRNPVYAGKVYVPEIATEEGYLNQGIHEAIVSEELFFKAQKILNKRTEASSYPSTRENPNDFFDIFRNDGNNKKTSKEYPS